MENNFAVDNERFYKNVVYGIKKFSFNLHISLDMLADSKSFSKEVRYDFLDDLEKEVVIRILYKVYGRDCEEIKYPKNWKEAIKERFAKWFIKRCPVRYKQYILTAMIPQHAIKGHNETFAFIEQPQLYKGGLKWT